MFEYKIYIQNRFRVFNVIALAPLLSEAEIKKKQSENGNRSVRYLVRIYYYFLLI